MVRVLRRISLIWSSGKVKVLDISFLFYRPKHRSWLAIAGYECDPAVVLCKNAVHIRAQPNLREWLNMSMLAE